MKKGTPRRQVTLLVAAAVTLACLILTVNSIFSAKGYYSTLVGNPETLSPMEREELDSAGQRFGICAATRQFSFQSVAVMLAVIAASVLATNVLAKRLLRPLTRLIRSIQSIDQGRSHER